MIARLLMPETDLERPTALDENTALTQQNKAADMEQRKFIEDKPEKDKAKKAKRRKPVKR